MWAGGFQVALVAPSQYRVKGDVEMLRPHALTPPSLQAQPTDMRALQDFEEPDKLHIQMNDIITVIEGR